MKHLSVMIKPASGYCNMRCTYCFYADISSQRETKNYGFMPIKTACSIVDNMLADLTAGDEATLAFQGGEPTLAGLPFFADLLPYTTTAAKAKGVHIHYALQTNGTMLEENWIPLLKAHAVLVGLSIDGDKQLHDANRKGSQGESTYKRVMQTKRLLDKHQVPYNVLLTLTNQSARHPQKLWQFLLKEGIDYIQFTPCLNELDCEKTSLYALQPERLYQFYAALFPLWVGALQKGKYISVKLFDDLFHYFGRGVPNACGIHGRCAVQFVCEGDGSVFSCDFYMLDEYCLGSLAESKPSELFGKGERFLAGDRGYIMQEPCASCRYRQACNGGCKRMVDAMYFSGGTCWYARLLDEILPPLIQIGRQLS